jgi:hypothetical protein
MNSSEFPDDVKARAKRILESCGGGSVGAYTDSAGWLKFNLNVLFTISQYLIEHC